jgi:hypothetical protein
MIILETVHVSMHHRSNYTEYALKHNFRTFITPNVVHRARIVISNSKCTSEGLSLSRERFGAIGKKLDWVCTEMTFPCVLNTQSGSFALKRDS